MAGNLGWRLLDSELVKGAARIAGVDPKLAARFDERLDPLVLPLRQNLLAGSGVRALLPAARSIFLIRKRMLDLIRQEILQAAKQGNCVLVGRGSACALAGKAGAASTSLYMPPRARRRIGSRRAFPDQAQDAEHQLAAFDRRRAAVIRKFYQQEWCSRGLYHMLLNSCIGTEAMISATQCAAGLCVGTPESVAR